MDLMQEQEFTVYPRNGVYYVQFRDPVTGIRGEQRSTRKKTLSEAYAVIADWKRNGFNNALEDEQKSLQEEMAVSSFIKLVRSKKLKADNLERIISTLKDTKYLANALIVDSDATAKLIQYQKDFWEYDKSPYIKDKLLHGHRIGRYHALDCQHRIRYWEEYFGTEIRLGEVTRKHIRDFSLWIAEKQVGGNRGKNYTKELPKKRISHATINGIMNAGCLPIKWAYLHDEIPIDPTKGLMRFSGEAKKRGILTESEAKRLFEVEWRGDRERVASALAMTSGLRAGEILALKKEDIGEDRIYVRHSWSVGDGLKGTKTSKERIAPLISSIRKEMIALADSNPHGPKGFIFYGLLPDKPMVGTLLLDGFYDALSKIGISEEMRKSRGLCFHSWRHYFTAQLAAKLDARIVAHATGHATTEMLEHYANHELEGQLKTLNQAADEAFGQVINFKKKTA
jgi:integrase